MDAFFCNINPALTKSIKDTIPEPEISKLVQNYAGPDTADGYLQALVPLLSSAAAKQENSASPSGEEWKKTIEVLGLTQSALNDWPAATSTWQKIVDRDDEKTKDDHPDRDLAAMFNLGLALNHMQRYAEAEQMFKRLLPMLEGAPKLGKSSQQYVGSLSALMLAVGKQGRVDEVRKLYGQHVAIVNQYSEPEYSAHSNTAKRILNETEHEAREK